jgi:hypothetical protein
VLSVSGLAAVAAVAALVAGTPGPLPVVCVALSALATVHVLGGHLLQQIERHLGVDVLAWVHGVKSPAAADDRRRLLRL